MAFSDDLIDQIGNDLILKERNQLTYSEIIDMMSVLAVALSPTRGYQLRIALITAAQTGNPLELGKVFMEAIDYYMFLRGRIWAQTALVGNELDLAELDYWLTPAEPFTG